jgi:enoyl-CoA hydratase/carnithine racemase
MDYPNFDTLTLRQENAALFVTIDNPPLNLHDAKLMPDLNELAGWLEAHTDDVTVVVFDSADPDFFIPHGDMNFVNAPETLGALDLGHPDTKAWNPMMRLHERIRKLPQVTIGKLKGLARGGGAELLSALDMRFAAIETAGLAQMEVPTGIIPGAGGTVYLPHLVGYARAMEIVVGADLVDAVTAERWGWVNQALPSAELDGFVDRLAAAIARRAPGVVLAAKEALQASQPDIRQALDTENRLLVETFQRPKAPELTRAAMAVGAQTRAGEKFLEAVLATL